MAKRINSRNKGHAYERKIRLEMIEFGFDECETSRYVNKKRDDEGVDLVGTDPWSLQMKAVEKNINTHKVLEQMPDDGNINLIFHKKNRSGEVVSMSKENFYKILGFLIKKKFK